MRKLPGRYPYSTSLFVALLAMLMVACSDSGTDAVGVTSVSSDRVATPIVGASSGPNSAILEWDAVSAPNLRGYRIYYGPDIDMYLQLRGEGVDAGNVTTYTITGLASGRRYYFAVTAVDNANNESDFSSQVFKDIP